MKIEDYYTQDEIDMMCMYYGQIPENLTRNMQIMLVEKFENEIVWKPLNKNKYESFDWFWNKENDKEIK